jgi:hypothetical protein
VSDPSPAPLAVAALLVSLIAYRTAERVPVNGGFGWDGVIYARWAKDFYHEIFVNRVDTYYIQRILPAAVVHFTLRLLSVPLTDANVMRAFALLSVGLFTVMGYVWGLIANVLCIRPAGRWLGFAGLFLNYVTLKHTFYVPITTDVCAYALGLLMLHGYLTGRTGWLAMLTAIGAFVWPLAVPVGALLIVFPRGGTVRIRLPLIAVAAGTLLALAGIGYAVYAGPAIVHGLVDPLYMEPLRPMFPLSFAVAGAYLFAGLICLVSPKRQRESSHPRWRFGLSRNTVVAVVLVVATIGGIRFLQNAWSNGRHFFGIAEMLAITAQCAVAKPGVFLVTHAAYYGPLFLLAVLLWRPVCRLIRRQGLGLTLAVLLGLLLSLNSQSRYFINIFVMVIPFVVKATDGLGWGRVQCGLTAGLGLLFSKCWLPMNTAPYSGRLLEFPDQLMFMTHGPWISTATYVVQGLVILATAYLLYQQVRKPGQLPALPLVVASSCGLSLIWVFTVPIYQSPDEPTHLDYALAIHAHGGPFVAQDTAFEKLPPAVHPYTAYLQARTKAYEISYSPGAKVEPGYGTSAYFAALDRDAPAGPIRVDGPNHLAAIYPFGYYTVLAGWIGLVRQFSDSLTVTFFAARILSVLLLAVTLPAIHGTLRLLNFSPRFALAVTAGIGLFPLTSFVSSYVQPDNLSWTLVSLSCYLALRWRRNPNWAPMCLLGLALGALAVTKAQFFAVTVVPVVAMLATRLERRQWLKASGATLLPSLVLGTIYFWTVWGTENYFGPAAAATDPLRHNLHYANLAVRDFFTGLSHDTFWGLFGWRDTPLVFGGPRTTAVVQAALRAFARLTVVLTLLMIARSAVRLLRLARKRRLGTAVRLIVGNPAVNGLLLFTLVMIALYVRTENRFGAQGRNWLPVILPVFLIGIVYAPRALAWRPAVRAYTTAAVIGLLLYDAVGGVCAVRSLRERYYAPFTSLPTERTPLSPQPEAVCLARRTDQGWNCSAGDAHLTYAVDPPQFVHGIRLEFKVENEFHGNACPRVVWRAGDGRERSAAFALTPYDGVRGLTVWTNGPVREFRVYPDVRPCRFEMSAVTVIH